MTQAFEIPRSVSRNVVRDLVLSASTGALDAYAVGGFEPEFVADFSGSLNSGTEYYRSGGTDTTFSSVFTHTKGDDKPFTMTDSDGNLKWAPHNFILASEAFDDSVYWTVSRASVVANDTTAPNGTSTADRITVTIEAAGGMNCYQSPTITGLSVTGVVYLKAGDAQWAYMRFNTTERVWFDLINGVVGTEDGATGTMNSVGNGWYRCQISATATSNVFNVVPVCISDGSTSSGSMLNKFAYVWGAHVYRSDLGGMANNPDRGDSYVPTTTAARCLPRRNHYLYNGSTYDNAGILIEPAAATNLFINSNNFISSEWANFPSNIGTLSHNAQGPDGVSTSALTLVDSNAGGTGSVYLTSPAVAVSNSTAYTLSIYAQAAGESWLYIETRNFTTPGNVQTFWNLAACTVGTAGTGIAARIEDVGGGWCRCSMTFTTDSVDNSGGFRIGVSDGDTDTTVALDGTSSILIYGAQFEEGSVPTSYIPTSGSTVTRAAETLTVAGANLPYSATAMSFHWNGTLSYADRNAVGIESALFEWYSSISDFITFRLDTNGGYVGRLGVASIAPAAAGALSYSATQKSPGLNVGINVASRHTTSALEFASDGVSNTPSAMSALPSLSSSPLTFGNSTSSGSKFVGTVGLFRAWGTDIGEAGIEEASS